jgi:hypothetical protein
VTVRQATTHDDQATSSLLFAGRSGNSQTPLSQFGRLGRRFMSNVYPISDKRIRGTRIPSDETAARSARMFIPPFTLSSIGSG